MLANQFPTNGPVTLRLTQQAMHTAHVVTTLQTVESLTHSTVAPDEPARYVGKSVSNQRPRNAQAYTAGLAHGTRRHQATDSRVTYALHANPMHCHCQEAKLKVPSVPQHNPLCVEQRSRPQAYTQQTRQRIIRPVAVQHKQPDDPSVLRRIQMRFEQRPRRRGHPNPNRQMTKSHRMHQDRSYPTRTSEPWRASSAKSLHLAWNTTVDCQQF
jgi:hypothetical protein